MKDLIDELNSKRREYAGKPLSADGAHVNPFNQFEIWMEEAVHANVPDPTAMVLSTVDQSGMPNSRVVALRGFGDKSFVFYTNYDSDKAKEIISCKSVALNFFWVELDRQIRIRGTVNKCSEELSEKYFNSRPLESKISAIASPQSQKIENSDWLNNQFNKIKESAGNEKYIRPENWGGFNVLPYYFEFWQGRTRRLHDRVSYELNDGAEWARYCLAP